MKHIISGLILGIFLFTLALTAGYGISRLQKTVDSKEISATSYSLLRRLIIASPDKPVLKYMLIKAFEDGKITEKEDKAIWDRYDELKIKQEKIIIQNMEY